MLIRLLLKIAINSAALYAASLLLDKVVIEPNIAVIVFSGFMLWVGYEIIRPILKLLTLPLSLVTFGLFGFIINVLILWGVDIIVPQLVIEGMVPLVLATLIVTAINSVFFFI